MKSHFGKIIFGIILLISIIYWICISFKAMLFFNGTFSLLMFINVSATTLCNALIGREISTKNDVFWKLLFILISCICYTLYFTI